MRTECPHCNSNSTSRKVKQITPLYREITFSCNNLDCGYIFVASLSPVRTLSPPTVPDPSVNIPLSIHISKAQLSA